MIHSHLLAHQPRTIGLIFVSVPLIDRSGAGALCALADCYIGRAEFRGGEDMKMYPFFGTFAEPMPQ